MHTEHVTIKGSSYTLEEIADAIIREGLQVTPKGLEEFILLVQTHPYFRRNKK